MSASEPQPLTRRPDRLAALGRLGRLVRKELSEILRDRRTIITLVLMPLLLYPLLALAFQQFFLASGLRAEKDPGYRLGFTNEPDQQVVSDHLAVGHEVLRTWAKRQGSTEPEPPQVFGLIDPDAAAALREGRVDLVVRLEDRTKVRREQGLDAAADCRLTYNEDSPRSREAAEYVERLLAAANGGFLERRLGAPGKIPYARLLRPAREGVKDPELKAPLPVSALVPLILILMTITGAVYPAIDLTAGERERGTLEILVAAPVPRLGLLFAKYVTVVAVAVLTALINLTALVTTVSLYPNLGELIFGPQGLSALLLAEMFALLLLFAAFFSALLLVLTSFARSFKEAQAYLVPLMLVSLAPGLMALMPGLSLSGLLTVTPLINIVLLARDLLDPNAFPSLGAAAAVVGSTLLYALVAIAAAARVFGAEGVLYSEQTSWSDLLRRPAWPSDAPTVTGALFCLALMFPASFVLQAALTPRGGPPDPLLTLGLLTLTGVLLFGVLPLAGALLRRVRLAPGFRVLPARWTAFAAALLLGVSLWPFVLQLLGAMYALEWTTVRPSDYARLAEPMRLLREVPLPLVVAVFVLTALLEELFFRGYLFSALRSAAGPGTTVVASAVLFGLFHLVGFGLERVLPSALLGLVLGWVAWKSGSVLPPMLLHGCHNAILIAVGYRQPTDIPPAWLAAAAVGVVLGAAVLLWGSRRPLDDGAVAGSS